MAPSGITVDLRRATLADADAVAHVYLRSRKELVACAPLAHPDDDVRRWIRSTLLPAERTTIALVDGRVAGFVSTSRTEDSGWIDQLYVLPDRIGAGIGTRLLAVALRALSPPIGLFTFAANARARRFYERHGFVPIAFSDGSSNEERVPDVHYDWRSELRTERLRLRRWTAADREPFAALNADPIVREHFPGTLTRAESDDLAERIEEHFATRGFGHWAIEVPGVVPFAGSVGLWTPEFEAPFTPCVEIGWRLARAHWGHGYVTEAATAALAFGFDTLGLDEVVSFTVPTNVRSRRVMERLGMTRDPRDDFDHPELPAGHPQRRHVLYRKRAPRGR